MTTELPFITIVMPVRNEGAFIHRSLGAALKQDYPNERMELIVADGMSTDDTREIVRSHQMEFARLRLVDNPGADCADGPECCDRSGAKRNNHPRGRPYWSLSLITSGNVSPLGNAPARIMLAGVLCAISDGWLGRAVALATQFSFGVGGARFHYSEKEEWVDTVYMGAWPRDIFRQIGLFDEEQVRNQDDEFNYRLLERGGKILLCPQIKSMYYNRIYPALPLESILSIWLLESESHAEAPAADALAAVCASFFRSIDVSCYLASALFHHRRVVILSLFGGDLFKR
ncbi:MAG: glycosyltransferase [Pyrinomonadaceae bacterium]